jgi:hypothetical protein
MDIPEVSCIPAKILNTEARRHGEEKEEIDLDFPPNGGRGGGQDNICCKESTMARRK